MGTKGHLWVYPLMTLFRLFLSSPFNHSTTQPLSKTIMRHITSTGLALIQRFEGFSATIYNDAAGLPTIGYGHLIRAGESFPAGGISRAEAERLLLHDVRVAERAVLRLIDIPLADNRFDALTSFTFNLGSAALQRSTLRRKVNRGEHAAAAEEFLRWVWAGGRRLSGLLRRRMVESDLYMTGVADNETL